MKNNTLKAGMIASLVMALAAPAVMPTVVLAQTDIRQEDRRADRQQDRQADRREDRQVDRREDRRANTGGELRGLDRADKVAGEHGQLGRDEARAAQMDRQMDRQVDHRADRGGHTR